MVVIDAFVELTGQDLRDAIEWCLEGGGTISIGYHSGQDRMEERGVTGGQVIAALRGKLSTESCAAGKWRYMGERNGIGVVFTFEADEDGQMLIVVTVMRV